MRTIGSIHGSAIVLFCSLLAAELPAQLIGVELHNNLMPASGGMAGASLARPQDLQSAINANPATLTQFHGTQFSFSGGWVEPTFNLGYDGSVPALNLLGLSPFQAKSGAPGAALANIGITQDISALGMPATFGVGLVGASGASAEWRAAAGSNGTTVSLIVLDIITGVGVDLTDRVSLGASLSLGMGFLDGPWVGAAANTIAYGMRGRFGLSYDLTERSSLGLYYQTKQHFGFDDNIRFPIPGPAGDVYLDTNLDLPQNVGIGIANHHFLDGRLLLSADVLYKQWTNADFFGALYEDQWVVQLGAQYTVGRVRLRMGYAWAENPLRDNPGSQAGGVAPPGGRPVIEYVQSTLAVVNEHRITGGIGISDVLPGVDLDVFAGGMFEASQDFAGGAVSASIETYFVGAGLTWHFGRGACEYGPWTADGFKETP